MLGECIVARPKKDGERFCCYLRKDIVAMIDDYSAETSIPKTAIVEKALMKYFEEIKKLQTDSQEKK